MEYYSEAGWSMMDECASWPDGGNGVEVGLMKLNDLMLTGKFKIFDDLWEVIEEVREYHRKQTPSGMPQIVKLKDDLISAIRYAFMSTRHAVQKRDIMVKDAEDWYEPPTMPSGAMGY